MPSKTTKKEPKKAAPTPKPSAEGTVVANAPKKGPQPIQLIRGMRDLLPADQPHWKKMSEAAERLAFAYGYDRIETPLVEETALFIRGVGRSTDIVEKELYSWQTPGGENVSLRPEGTASVVRSYIQQGMVNLPQPVKLWYQGPMFRYDRPQAGRFREFFQLGFECIGEADAVLDAHLAIIGWAFMKELGIEATVRINSIGTPESRANYKNALVSYFRSKRGKLSEDDKRRLLKNPLRILDSKDPSIAELKAEAPQIVDWLDDDSKAHFTRVLEYLDEVGVPYELDPYLVRGLDYYTKTVFEYYAPVEGQEEGAQAALGGGGRYDGLVELLGGRPTPAVGMSLGLDRIVSRLKENDRLHGVEPVTASLSPVEVFLAQISENGRKRAVALFEEFRHAGIPVAEAFAKTSLKSQMEIANRRKAKWAVIIGQKEILDGTAIIRDMDSGTQEIVDVKKVVNEIRKKMQSRGEGV